MFANLGPPVFWRDPAKLDTSRGCYWSIAAFTAGAVTQLAAGALEVRSLVIDDVGGAAWSEVSEGAVELALGRPTARVLSSAGNTQWVWRLSRPVSKDDWPMFFAEIERLIGPPRPMKGRDAVHMFRLPMGKNTKHERGNFDVVLVELNAGVMLDVDKISYGPASSPAAGGGAGASTMPVRDPSGLMQLVPNPESLGRDGWVQVGHQLWALTEGSEDGFAAFDEWSSGHSTYDATKTRKLWDSIHGVERASGKALLETAEREDASGYKTWMDAEGREAFDDGAGPPSSPGSGGGVDFFVDQEKSSIEVVKHFGGRLKQVGRGDWREFVEETGRWRTWTGDHMMRRVLELVRERKGRALDPEVSKKLGSVKFIEGIARAAGLHRSVVAEVTDFDRLPLVLGVPSGVVDLGPGLSRNIRKGSASEMVSKSMWVDPAAPGTACPEWSRFLGEFTQGDQGLEKWLQVRAGYCLTGLMDEPVMPFYYGSGGNGKSVYLNALRSVWGEYGTQMDHRLLFEKTGGYHLAPLAVLAGVRLAVVTDVPQGAVWDVLIMKMLTGDDAITANRMHQNPITFKSTAKVDVSGNGEPTVKDMDDGIRRRLKMIPLKAKPRVVDKQLGRKLLGEYPAILGWALAGLDEYWRLGGFPASKVVEKATDGYHAMLDPFGRWVEGGVVRDQSQGAKVAAADLFKSWDAYRSAEGVFGVVPNNVATLVKKLEAKGFAFSPTDGRSYLRGYKLAKSASSEVF